jgi:predicted ATPase
MFPELWGFDEPELHTHPRVQATMGDLLIEATLAGESWPDQKSVLIGSHSEHLLLRLLRRIRETGEGDLPAGHPGLTPDKLSVVYLESTGPAPADGQTSSVGIRATPLRIDSTGEFLDQWPHGFFEERAKELF